MGLEFISKGAEFSVTLSQFLIIAAAAALFTLPAVLFIPRQRQSTVFDWVLWSATWLLAFLCGWSAPNYSGDLSVMLYVWTVDGISVIPTLIGAAVGAFSINLLLWAMDRFSPAIEEIPTFETTEVEKEEEDGADSNNSQQ